jgi:hypothetical protein
MVKEAYKDDDKEYDEDHCRPAVTSTDASA